MRLCFAFVVCVLVLVIQNSKALAQSYCSQPNSWTYSTFESLANANFKYLICLHNEQVDQINSHANILNSDGTDISKIAKLVAQLNDAISLLKAENYVLQESLKGLEARISDLEAQE